MLARPQPADIFGAKWL